MSAVAAEVSKNDLMDFHVKRMEDRFDFDEKRNDDRFASMERLMVERFDKMQYTMTKNFELVNERMEKNLARYEAVALETRAEVSDIRGDVKALGASVQSFQHRRGWDIAWTGIVIGAVIGLIQMFTAR